MDDYLDSFHTVQEAIKVSNDVTNALSEGGFHLTKWVSKDQQILKALPSQEVSSTLINLDFDDISIEGALGILGNPGTDALQIKVTAKDVALTKRGILSYTSLIFDPLGILAPIILEPKLIIQSLWKQKIDWDSEIPTDLKQRFLLWKEKLQSWDAIQIQRWYGLNSSADAELHTFTDASTLVYGAVAYFRYNEGNNTRCYFIISKSHLAPIKQKTLTVPKLELQAAVVACRMKNVILDEVKLGIKSVHFWCDSKTTINYLKNETTNFGVYIAHRVNEIRRSSSIEDWYYVPTKLNVADGLTRFTGFQTLTNQSRWCRGPEFLLQDNI